MKKSADETLTIGIPKGSLQESTIELFRKAGFKIGISPRSYFPSIDHDTMDCVMFRAQEMSRYVEDGIVDVGLTGYDWVLENNSDVHEICSLQYSKATSRPARWVLAVPEESDVQRVEDLEGGVIATELVNVTEKFFAEKGVSVKVEFSWGATEVKARMLDAIVDVTETGGSLRANKLRIVDTVMVSTTRLIANRDAMNIEWKKEEIENMAMLLGAAIDAGSMVGLKMNVPADSIDNIMKLLPAEKSPTVSHLQDEGWVAVEVVLHETDERNLAPKLKKAGASGIITYPLNKIIH